MSISNYFLYHLYTQLFKMAKVLNPKLYKQAKDKYKHLKHSAYKSGLVVKEYKRLGGKYEGDKPKKKGLSRWFKEKWRNQRGEVGYKKKGDIYRPTKRITKKTPTTIKEISKKEVKRAMKEKKSTGRVKKFKKK